MGIPIGWMWSCWILLLLGPIFRFSGPGKLKTFPKPEISGYIWLVIPSPGYLTPSWDTRLSGDVWSTSDVIPMDFMGIFGAIPMERFPMGCFYVTPWDKFNLKSELASRNQTWLKNTRTIYIYMYIYIYMVFMGKHTYKL